MAPRTPRRGTAKRPGTKPRKVAPETAGSGDIEEVAARAARLGITPERVLLEYAHIAFADLRHIIEWGPDGFRIKAAAELSSEDAAAISEIVPGSDPGHSRVKLYDKKAALDAIARHLGMFPAASRRPDAETPVEEGEDPREFLARELARLAAGTAEK